MPELTRRQFTEQFGAAGVAASAGMTVASPALAGRRKAGRVVIVGGGAGGTTVARHLKSLAPEIDITLVEVNSVYSSAFLSEHFIGGFRSLGSLSHGYDGLIAAGIHVIHDLATAVDADTRKVTLLNGDILPYDKLVLSPGIELRYDTIQGYSRDAAKILPHAWQNGAQNLVLRNQLLDMKDGGVVAMSIPHGEIRGGTAAYTRASMIAHYLKYHKPKSKLILIDGNNDFPQRAVFQDAWQEHYGDILEHRLSTEPGDGSVVRVDANTRELETRDGDREQVDVINIIPEQRAGVLAQAAGCMAEQWCPIDPATFASSKVANIHVLGDAADTRIMPKTAYVANSQGGAVANHLAAELAGKRRFPARYRNTQWSLIATNHAIKTGGNYVVGKDSFVEASTFGSDVTEPAAIRARNFEESLAWYDAVTSDMFGAV